MSSVRVNSRIHCLSSCKYISDSVSSIYHAIAGDPDNRGLLVQQGGAKALIPFALDGTKIGKLRAAQALAKISITTNPEIAFPGQRVSGHFLISILLLEPQIFHILT